MTQTSNWNVQTQSLEGGRVRKSALQADGRPVSYADVVDLWQKDESFRAFFIALLAEAPFEAYFWETPPVTTDTVQSDFEFVLVDSPSLDGLRADPSAFESHFAADTGNEGVVTFTNLGKDARLVAPCPISAASAYGHLAAFTREAPGAQQHALWRHVGAAAASSIERKPLWLSTAGLGVPWLHVRLDSRPKYYRYQPYKTVPV